MTFRESLALEEDAEKHRLPKRWRVGRVWEGWGI